MAFKKGHKKVGGRKAGTPNKTPKTVKDKFLEVICDYVESGQFSDDLNSKLMHPADRLNIVVKVANYILPKQSSVDSTINVKDESQQSVLDRLNQLAQDNENVE